MNCFLLAEEKKILMSKLDEIDLKILGLLQVDARMTIKEIAAQLNLSTTPIFARIKKLENEGIIDRYVAVLNPEKLGKKLNAFANISIKEHSKKAVQDFVEKVISFPEVMECHYVTGTADFILKVLVEDIEQYNLFVLDKLADVPNIGKVESLFSLSVGKKTNVIPLD